MSPAKPEAKNRRNTASMRRLKGLFLRRIRKGPREAALSLYRFYCSAARLTAGRGQVLRDDRGRGGVAGPRRDRRAGRGGRRGVRERLARAELRGERATRVDGDQARGDNDRRDGIGGTDVGAAGLRLVGREHTNGLVVLSNGGLADARGVDELGYLRADGVVLVGRNGDGRKDADDRDNDHQFDKRETFLDVLHVFS